MKLPCFLVGFLLALNLLAQETTPLPDSLCPAQTDIIDVFWKLAKNKRFTTRERDAKKFHFSFLPISSGSVDGTPILITTFSGAFYTGEKEKTNLSNIYFTPYLTPSAQFVFPLKSNIWWPGNAWNFVGDWRYMVYNENTYGLGSNSIKENGDLIHYDLFRFYQSALKKIKGHLTGGMGYYYDHYFGQKETWYKQTPSSFHEYPTGTGPSSSSSGFSTILSFDSRKNSINPQQGIFASAIYRVNPTWLGSDETWESLYLDARKYYSFSPCKQRVLALWAFFWDTFNQDVPYMELPAIGWEPGARSGRGYDAGRFRGKSMFYAESEFRFDITANGMFGMVVFANASSVKEPVSGNFESIRPAAGSGIRLNFNKASRTHIACDVGFGYRSMGVYLNLGEYF